MDNFRCSLEAEGTPGLPNSVTPQSRNPSLDDRCLSFIPSQPQMGGTLEIMVSYRNAGLEVVSDVEVMVWMLPDIKIGIGGFPELVEPGEHSVSVSLLIDALPGGRLAFAAAVVSDGSSASAEDDTVTVTLDVPVPQGTILLNEVMAAPATGEAEWVEIYNRGASAVDLFNWAVCDSRGIPCGMVNSHILVNESGYAVISGGELSYDVPDESPVVVVEGFPALNNEGDSAGLLDFTGTLADSMEYDEAPSGQSFELMSPEMSGKDSGWDTCVDPVGATPGALNSIHYSTDGDAGNGKTDNIELSAAPNPFSEMTAISYRLPFPIARVRLYVYDRRGRLIAKLRDEEESGSEWAGTWDGRSNGSQLPAGPYILNLEVLNKRSGKAFTERKTIVIGRRL